MSTAFDVLVGDPVAGSMEERARAAGIQVVDYDPEGDPRFTEHPFDMLDWAHEQGGLFYSTAARGFFVAADYETNREIFQNADAFSVTDKIAFSREHVVLKLIPVAIDPPDHTEWRRLLNPLFSPPVVAAREDRIRAIARELVDGLADRDEIDAANEFALQVPALFFLEWMGLDPREVDRFTALATEFSFKQIKGSAYQQSLNEQMYAILDELYDRRRAEPKDDLATQLLAMERNGRKLSQDELRQIGSLLFSAGLETTAMSLSFMLMYLAEHPDDRRRIVSEPGLVVTAVEELLRVRSALSVTGRNVVKDVTINGCPMHPGDRVFLALPAANRHMGDEGPDEVDLARWPNRHIVFGLGIHRCLGSHLARAELRISLEEWHRRFPEYRIKPDADIRYYSSQQQRPITLPLEIQRG